MALNLMRAGSLSGYFQLVSEMGADPEVLLESSGLAPDIENRPEEKISYLAFLEALNRAAAATGCAHFGLLLSARQRYSMFGILGLQLKYAPSLRVALDTFCRNYSHHGGGGHQVGLIEEGRYAMWTFDIVCSNPPPTGQQVDLAAGLGCSLLRSLLNRSDCVESVHLARRKPENLKIYRQFLTDDMLFDQQFSAALFRRELLDCPQAGSDEDVLRLVDERLSLQYRQQAPNSENDFQRVVRGAMRDGIHSGNVSMKQVAGQLALSPRTLQRKLRDYRTSFRDELDEIRTELSLLYLRDTDLSIIDISSILCYSSLASFSSFFKRRFNISPGDWRKSMKIADC